MKNRLGSVLKSFSRNDGAELALQVVEESGGDTGLTTPESEHEQRNKRFYRAVQLVSEHTSLLSHQVFRALEAQESFLSEVSQRANKLDDELNQAKDHLNRSNHTVHSMQQRLIP